MTVEVARNDRPAAPQRWRALIMAGVATVVSLAILVGLGTWQLQRLAWKEGVVSRKSRPGPYGVRRGDPAQGLSGYAFSRTSGNTAGSLVSGNTASTTRSPRARPPAVRDPRAAAGRAIILLTPAGQLESGGRREWSTAASCRPPPRPGRPRPEGRSRRGLGARSDEAGALRAGTTIPRAGKGFHPRSQPSRQCADLERVAPFLIVRRRARARPPRPPAPLAAQAATTRAGADETTNLNTPSWFALAAVLVAG